MRDPRRTGPSLTAVLLAGAILAGCGGGSSPDTAGDRPFVLVPSLPALPPGSAGIRAVIAYEEGFDRFPEYAKVARCGVEPGRLTWQLQFSATPPIGVGVTVTLRDRTTGRTFTAGDPTARLRWLERPEDQAPGRTSFAGTEAVADLDPGRGLATEIRSEDCALTIHWIP